MGFTVLLYHLEWEEFNIMLDSGVTPFATDETLSVEHRVFGVGRKLILGSISNKTFTVAGEGNVRWSDTVTLVVGDDFNTSILVYAHTVDKKNFWLFFVKKIFKYLFTKNKTNFLKLIF